MAMVGPSTLAPTGSASPSTPAALSLRNSTTAVTADLRELQVMPSDDVESSSAVREQARAKARARPTRANGVGQHVRFLFAAASRVHRRL